MSAIVTLIIIAAAVVLGIALAYVPMRLLLTQIARNVTSLIQRQRDRRRTVRETPDRRKDEDVQAPTPAP